MSIRLNVDYVEAMEMACEAYDLLKEFQLHIDNSCEGDHPVREAVANWISNFEDKLHV